MNFIERMLLRKKAESVVDSAIKESSMSAPMKAWLIAAANAIGSGLFATGGAQVAGASMKQTLIIALIAGIGSFGKWWAQHPIPGGQS